MKGTSSKRGMREAVETREDEGSSGWRRWAVTAAGGTLLAWGLRRRSFSGFAGAMAGGWMLYRGLRGGDGREFELVSLEAPADAVEVERTLTVQAP